MKKASIASRLFALLLVVVMVVGIAPVINLAEVSAAQKDPVIVIAGSDFQAYKTSGGSNVSDPAGGAAQVKSILGAIQKDYYDVNALGMQTVAVPLSAFEFSNYLQEIYFDYAADYNITLTQLRLA